MASGVCHGCNSPILTEESIFCHKCGARLQGGSAARGFEAAPFAVAGAPPEERKAPENAEVPPSGDGGMEARAEEVSSSGGARGRTLAETLIDAWSEFSGNYYRLPFNVSVAITLAAAAYAVLPFDLVPAVPLIGWVDDALILACALINLFHCGVEASNHSENVTFQRVKLVVFPLAAAVIFLTWFGASILLIFFQKPQP